MAEEKLDLINRDPNNLHDKLTVSEQFCKKDFIKLGIMRHKHLYLAV